MKRITGTNLRKLKPFFTMAANEAQHATCLNAQCGTVIVKDNQVIGRGYNSPPLQDESNRMCQQILDTSRKPNYDLTCCIHAEWQAILDACKHFPKEINGSTLYFIRIDENGTFMNAGKPYCTNCSRLAMEAGISWFGLWNDNGANLYQISDYNQQSYRFFKLHQ